MCHLACLRHQLGDGTTAAAAPRQGDGTVGAIVVTAVLHLEPVARAVAALARRRELADERCVRHGHLLLALREPALHVLGDVVFLLAAQHDVHTGDGRYLLAFKLCVAARHHHQRLGESLHQAADVLAPLFVGQLGDAASVHHAHVGRLPIGHRHNAAVGQQFPHCGRFREVEFAPECLKMNRV